MFLIFLFSLFFTINICGRFYGMSSLVLYTNGIPCFMLFVYCSMFASCWQHYIIAITMLLSSIADILLQLNQHIVKGIVLFYGVHLLHVVAAMTLYANDAWYLIPLLVLLNLAFLYYFPLQFPSELLKWIVHGYLLVSIFPIYVAMADVIYNPILSYTHLYQLIGLILFLICDFWIAIDMFRQSSMALKIGSISIYWIGQLLISISVTKL